MKNQIRIYIIISTLFLFLFLQKEGQSQPDPPPLPVNHGINGNPSPHGAPAGNGTEILLLLGFIYAVAKIPQKRKEIAVEAFSHQRNDNK